MIFCKALDKSFETKEAMFKELIERKDEMLELKKAVIKETDALGLGVLKSEVSKAEDGRKLDIGNTVSVVINTSNYLDTHDDVHLPSIWNKTIVEQKNKIYHIADHELKTGKIVAYPKDVSLWLKDMTWRELGLNVDGITRVLGGNSLMTDKTNQDVFKAYRDNDPVQHSLKMKYVLFDLALNDPSQKKEYEVWNAVLPTIANKEKAIEQGYFFAHSEAKIVNEFSTVLFGSNDITPFLGFKSTQLEPSTDTRKEPFNFLAACKRFKINN